MQTGIQDAAGKIASMDRAITGSIEERGGTGVEFAPGQVRYIKLGQGGAWAAKALALGAIPFGYPQVSHALCASGRWEEVGQQLKDMGRTKAGVSQGLRELRDFYELPGDTLWVTVADGHVWWVFAEGPVTATGNEGGGSGEPSRQRATRNGWSRQSLTGEALTTASLSSALTRTANYRMTICGIDRADYLLRRIRGEQDPLHRQALALQQQMRQLALAMIRQLDWADFETLVDLVFSRNGWRRGGVLGRNQADVDLLLDHPVTGELAWVQVKSATNQAELDDYLGRFARDGSAQHFFYVCHTQTGLRLPGEPAPASVGRRQAGRDCHGSWLVRLARAADAVSKAGLSVQRGDGDRRVGVAAIADGEPADP